MSKLNASEAKLLLWSCAATVVALPVSSQVHAQVRGVVDVSAQGTVASNPFLEQGGDGGAAAIGLQIDPSIYYEGGEVTTAALRGTVAFDQYDAEYGRVGSLGLTAGVQHQVSARTNVGLTASIHSTRSVVRDFLRNPGRPVNFLPGSGELDPVQGGGGAVPDVLGGLDPDQLVGFDPDLTEAGGRGRTNSYSLGASLEHVLSPVDYFSLQGSVGFNTSEDTVASDYRSDRLAAFYHRKLSSRTSVNAGISGGRADYEEGSLPGQGDGSYLTPTVGVSRRLSETLTADISLGASFIKVEGFDEQTSKVGFAGSAGLCYLQVGGSLCASASRGAQPTSYGGVTSVTSAQIGYNRSFGPKDELQASVGYSRRGASLLQTTDGLGDSQSALAVSVGYNRRIGQRIYAFVTPSYARTSGGVFSESLENLQVSFGVRYRYGNTE